MKWILPKKRAKLVLRMMDYYLILMMKMNQKSTINPLKLTKGMMVIKYLKYKTKKVNLFSKMINGDFITKIQKFR